MRKLVLVLALSLGACSLVQIDDQYGTAYGGWYNHGDRYRWQLATCENDLGARTQAQADGKRWMECCMWRNGVPIDDPTGCAAPEFAG